MSAIVLPGSIPGLLRRGSPVVGVHTGAAGVVVGVVEGGVSSWTGEARRPAAYVATRESHTAAAEFSALALDLSIITGMTHAAIWLAEQVGVAVGSVGPGWEYCGEGRWFLRSGDGGRGMYFVPLHDDGSRVRAVPALADLDRNEPDPAEALRRVVLHVAGVQP